MNETGEAEWLLVDIDGDVVNFGMAVPSSNPIIHKAKTYKTDQFPTATDCFMTYARETGISLNGLHSGLVVSGAVNNDTIRIQRCKWIISVTGIGHLMGSRPIVINDSEARSWVNLNSFNTMRKLGGTAEVDFMRAGRWVTVNYNRGLGASVLQRRHEGAIFALDSECGHIAFAPQSSVEQELANLISTTTGRVTYEQVLFISNDSPVWDRLSKPTTMSERMAVRAGILGSFSGDLVLAFAAWSGLFLHSNQAQLLIDPYFISIFNERFEDKASFKANVRSVPRFLANWEVTNLQGLAQMMAETQAIH
jgi:glucokinase